MASTSGSKRRPSRPTSPPLTPPRRVRRQRLQVSEEREKKEEKKEEDKPLIIKRHPRRYGKEVYEEPADDPPPETSEEAKRRPILVQDYQEPRGAERDELQFAAYDIFLSNNPWRYLSLVSDFASSSALSKNNPLSQHKTLWNFCARRYPNALSLMLAYLLNSPELPLGAGVYTVKLLHLTLNQIHRQDPSTIDDRVLLRLKSLLLNVIDNHKSIPNMLNLSEIVARMFETQRWLDLLDYLLKALHTDFETRQEMALRVLITLPEEECFGAYRFWKVNYKSLYFRFFELLDSPSLIIQALTFDASVKLIRLLRLWRFYNEIDDLLQKVILLLRACHMDGQIDIVEPRIMDLAELARYYTGHILKRLDVVLDCMFQIAVTTDDNTFLKCKAIEIIKMLDEHALVHVSKFLQDLSEQAKSSIIENCVRLMFCIADVPAWYDMESSSTEQVGVSGSYHLGKFLLFRVCMHSQEDILVSFGIEMIPQYLTSEDWQTRHAGLIAFSAIGGACGPVI
ncbi:uncharacterized protein LOC114722408 [Neltuma alba]|uniref:uncharacterized protein LOC114722408 n=1 Tax=Neltuma alba TaxID=207710 RepID=UPI0010A330D5|nr:uncharacterized protein LOC114722408 [Prosopis alba]